MKNSNVSYRSSRTYGRLSRQIGAAFGDYKLNLLILYTKSLYILKNKANKIPTVNGREIKIVHLRHCTSTATTRCSYSR